MPQQGRNRPIPSLRVARAPDQGSLTLETKKGKLTVSQRRLDEFLPALSDWLKVRGRNYVDPLNEVYPQAISELGTDRETWSEVLEWIYDLMAPDRRLARSSDDRNVFLRGDDEFDNHFKRYCQYKVFGLYDQADFELQQMLSFISIFGTIQYNGRALSVSGTLFTHIWMKIHSLLRTLITDDESRAFDLVDTLYKMMGQSDSVLGKILALPNHQELAKLYVLAADIVYTSQPYAKLSTAKAILSRLRSAASYLQQIALAAQNRYPMGGYGQAQYGYPMGQFGQFPPGQGYFRT